MQAVDTRTEAVFDDGKKYLTISEKFLELYVTRYKFALVKRFLCE